MQGDRIKSDICNVDVRAISLDSLECPEIVEGGVWKRDTDACAILFKHRGNKNVVTEEELVLDGKRVFIARVVVEEGVEDGQTGEGLAVKSGV